MKKRWKWCFSLLAIGIAAYLTSVLYYALTDGFTVGNITSNFTYNPKWETRPLSEDELKQIDQILSQPYSYLGKGCQSYVFESQDGQYVLKFFKYQRYRLKPWSEALSIIPFIKNHTDKRLQHKNNKLDHFFTSWRVAFDRLQPETGLVYVHLNKTHSLNKSVIFKDKLGFEHPLNIDQYEFMIQKKAKMLTDVLQILVAKNDFTQANQILTELLEQMMSEFKRGLGDYDFALIQNTGVIDGHPIHIDIGQFVEDEELRKPEVYKQSLFNKTFKFRIWLRELSPPLDDEFERQLEAIIGPQMHTMIPYFQTLDD